MSGGVWATCEIHGQVFVDADEPECLECRRLK